MIMKRVLFVILIGSFALSFSNAQVSAKKLIKEHKKLLKQYKDATDMVGLRFKTNGLMKMNKIQAEVDIYVSENNMRFETKVMGTIYYQVDTDSLTWSYDPFTSKYSFEPPSEDKNTDDPGGSSWFATDKSQLTQTLDLGYTSKDVVSVKLDSIDAYKMTMTLDTLERYFYFDQSDNTLIGHEWDGGEYYYLNPQEFEGRLWPMIYLVKSEDENMQFEFYKFDAAVEFENSLFELPSEAMESYQQYLEALNAPAPSTFEEIFNEANDFRKSGEYEKAKAGFDEAIRMKPNHHGAYNLRGLVKLNMNDQYGAIADFKKSLELRPENPAPYSNMGLAKYYLGDYQNAINDYEKAISLDSTNHTYFSNLGLVYMDQSDWPKMLAAFDNGIALKPDQNVYYYYRGMANAELDEYQAAVADYTKAAEQMTNSAPLFNYRGVSLYYLEEYGKAAEDFKKATALDPEDLQYPENYGNTLGDLERYEEAIAVYNQVLEQDSTRASTYYYRGKASYALERYQKALNDFEMASNYYSEAALYYDYMAYSKEKLGDLKGAIKDFTQSLNLEQDSNIYYRRGLLKLELKEVDDACRDFKSASELNDENGSAALLKHCSK